MTLSILQKKSSFYNFAHDNTITAFEKDKIKQK